MPQPSLFRQLWLNWKSLHLPWRRRWLRGSDLAGNTFWEFKDHAGATRLRRIVEYSRKTHYGDVYITPQWTQWLRYNRAAPPSLAEQEADLVRQARMKQLAADADARWAAKPSVLDPPDRAQMVAAPLASRQSPEVAGVEPEPINVQPEPVVAAAAARQEQTAQQSTPKQAKNNKKQAKKQQQQQKTDAPSPWDKHALSAQQAQEWQPESWTPKPASRKR
ncbi:uncharacterized protein K452DRAFT_258012 [Aplosporella prunicola CBS 121167]|uniref:Uncharacterized protein n=1 Tax=Aplosporella prunicola CBS 121167 TaxID=1176127 RepID=A0A6A6AZ71_9PEZI|nr:uncharacterized protein K452DRAFT_258012 [Aplosporella prunicola CBS 121167]KAF2137242.1 hypothetical protein K452DRAFT_258012 [Aplosporella prunicola CBS 121167]